MHVGGSHETFFAQLGPLRTLGRKCFNGPVLGHVTCAALVKRYLGSGTFVYFYCSMQGLRQFVYLMRRVRAVGWSQYQSLSIFANMIVCQVINGDACTSATSSITLTSCIANGARQQARILFYAILGFEATFVLGHLATSDAKSDVIFLLGEIPIFYKGDEISRLSRLVFEI